MQAALQWLGAAGAAVELPQTTQSAIEAAQAIGCPVAKSLIFRGQTTGKPFLGIASGVNRVNEKKLAEIWGEPVARADAELVRRRTGLVIGGIPPVGYAASRETYIDKDLWRHEALGLP